LGQIQLKQAIERNEGFSLLQKAINNSGWKKVYKTLSDDEKSILTFTWEFLSRGEQKPDYSDASWSIWLYLAGRGSGKTRSGSEFCIERVNEGYKRGALVARTAADLRDTLVEGEAGILTVAPPWNRPIYEPARRRLVWKETLISLPSERVVKTGGAKAITYSGDEPNQLRGPSHDFAWADELAHWKYMNDAWSNLMFGLRLITPEGKEPLACITTTPRPLPLIRELMKDPTVYVTTGSTYDNQENLAPTFYQKIIKRYEGTRLGRQEIYAEILDDNPNALFMREDLDNSRLDSKDELPSTGLVRIATAIDPAVSTGEESADTGIVTCGVDENDEYYIIEDRTCHKKPMGWALEALRAYHYQEADVIVGEVNNGGDMIGAVIENSELATDKEVIKGIDVPYISVRATRGKQIRAEPVSSLSQQGRLHIVGKMPLLEDQMCQWSADLGEKSPDRLDAMVWAITYLMKEPRPGIRAL
jgi:phage terminase large subunit-like protein